VKENSLKTPDAPRRSRFWKYLEPNDRHVVFCDHDILTPPCFLDQTGEMGLGFVDIYLVHG
jgi:hypothetical protein